MASIPPINEKFILHWGEMGTLWGVNRTVAQIHALLYLSPKPLTAEEIADTLSVARSNVSTSLKELQGWGIVKVVHEMGDRRDHFESMKDVWAMFRLILDERKKRETDPTLALLRELSADARKPGAADAATRQRLDAMLEFFESMSRCYESTQSLSVPAFARLVRMGDKIRKMLGILD